MATPLIDHFQRSERILLQCIIIRDIIKIIQLLALVMIHVLIPF